MSNKQMPNFFRLFFILFLMWSMVACDTDRLPEDDIDNSAQSHGYLDPDVQEKLSNPQKTQEALQQELEELKNRIYELENEIDLDKLEDTKDDTQTFNRYNRLKKLKKISIAIQKPKSIIGQFKKVIEKYIVREQILASPLKLPTKENNANTSEPSTQISLERYEDLAEKVEHWALQITQELDEGTRKCHAWALYFCKYEIRRLKYKALEWIDLPLSERMNLRTENKHFNVNPDADERFLGTVELGPELVEILDEIERRDREAHPRWARQVLEHSLWPDLTDEEKVERWADETLQAFEARKANYSLLNPNNFHWYYTRRVDADKSFLIEWIHKTPNERDQNRLVAKRRNRVISETLSFYDEDKNLRALWQSIEARDRMSRDERNRESISVWVSYEFSVRESFRRRSEGIEDMIDVSELPENLAVQVEDITEEDTHTRRQKFLDWTLLEWKDRQSLDEKNESIETQIDMESISADLRNQVQGIREQDEQRQQQAQYTEANKATLQWWTSLERCNTNGNAMCLHQQGETRHYYRDEEDGIRYRLDVSRLDLKSQEIIRNIENSDLQDDYEDMKKHLEQLASLSLNQRDNLRQRDQPDQWDPLYHSRDGDHFNFLLHSYRHIPEIRDRAEQLEDELDLMLNRMNRQDIRSKERMVREQGEMERQRSLSQRVEYNERIRNELLDQFKGMSLSERERLRARDPERLETNVWEFFMNQLGLDYDLREEMQRIEDEDIQERYRRTQAEIQERIQEGIERRSGSVNVRSGLYPTYRTRSSRGFTRYPYAVPVILDVQGILDGNELESFFRRPQGSSRRSQDSRGRWFPDYRSGGGLVQRQYYQKIAPLHNELVERIANAREEIRAERERREKERRQEDIILFVDQWISSTFQEREQKRLSSFGDHIYRTDEGIGIFIAGQPRSRNNNASISFRVSLDEIPFEKKDRILTIEEQDNQTRQSFARDQIPLMSSLTPLERFQQQQNVSSLKGQIDISRLDDDLKQQIEAIEEEDRAAVEQLASAELSRRMAMDYDERSALPQTMRDLFDVSKLSEDLRDQIRDLSESDREIARNRRRASQWAARKAREERLRAAIDTIQNQSIVDYRKARVKLWPIRCRNSNNPFYPYTNDNRAMHLSITDTSREGLKLEVRNDQLEESVSLAEDVYRVHLRINKPRDLYDQSNYIEYELGGQQETQVYPLTQLVDIQNTRHVYYIRVVPGNHHLRVEWDSIRNLRFRGTLQIEITNRGNSRSRGEWSLINVLPIEWYIRSVTASELLPDYTMDAHLAQAVAARSYFFNKALGNRNVQARGWDIDPTQCNQVYKGVIRRQQADIAIAETAGLVVTYNGRLAQTQYYACGTRSTKRGGNPIERPRNIPSNITCSGYARRIINNHGLGMPQHVANYLTRNGWQASNKNRPTEGAKIPDNIYEPWAWEDVINYFYRGEHPSVKIEDFRDL